MWRGTGTLFKASGDTGASLVEFALVLPILLILTFGIIEFGIALNRVQAVEAAAREGARLASISGSTQADVDARVMQALQGVPLQSPVVVAPVTPCQDRQGQLVEVVVTTQHQIDIPLVPAFSALQLRGQAVFRCEA